MQGGDLRTALWTDDIEGTDEWGWHQRGRAAALDVAEGLNFLHCNGIVHRCGLLDLNTLTTLIHAHQPGDHSDATPTCAAASFWLTLSHQLL